MEASGNLFPHVACHPGSSCIRTWPCRVWCARYAWIESMHRWPILTLYRRYKLTGNAKCGRPLRRLGDWSGEFAETSGDVCCADDVLGRGRHHELRGVLRLTEVNRNRFDCVSLVVVRGMEMELGLFPQWDLGQD